MTEQQVNPFEQPGRWVRACLHCHTTRSDGQSDVARRIEQYREAGYDLLAITDHRTGIDVDGLSDDTFLVVPGIETHPACPGANMFHLVGLGVSADIALDENAPATQHVETIRRAGGEVIFAHPYWCGHGVAQVEQVPGCVAIEVYNATCARIGRSTSSVIWDQLLEAGHRTWGVAVDDTHADTEVAGGWTMLKMPELTVPALLEALRTGAFFASSGPILHDVRFADGTVTVRCSGAVEIIAVCDPPRGRRVVAEGPVLREATLELSPGASWTRLEVVAPDGTRAWTNPVWWG